MNKNNIFTILGVCCAIIGIALVNEMDFNDQVNQHKYHCEGVKLWLDDAKYGVPEEQRSGWPDHNNSCEVSK